MKMNTMTRLKNQSLALLALVLLQAQPSLAAPAALTIGTKGEEMAFDKTSLTVKAGQKVKLTFKNGSGMQHNWVLVKPGAADAVGNASIAAGNSKGWLATGPDVLAHTKLVDPKQSDTIEFTAPDKPGDYPYLCTFPGHASIMRGVLKVK
jgi:azurin